MSGCQGNSGSITGLLGALCDCGLSGLSWKRRALGAASRESARRSLRKRAYGALLAGLFQDGSPKTPPNALANTPAHNKILMISFDLRVSGHNEEAERLEELLSQLRDRADSSGLSELDSVLELLVQLAGSVAPPPLSFSRDYMRRERPVQRRPPLGGYLSRDMQRLEERAWSLICGEEWGVFGGICRTLSIMDAPPGTGLLGLGRRQDTEEKFERETRLSLFGALQHSRTADMDVRLDLPPVPSNADLTGLSIRVPLCLDQSDDEGFQSASNLTPDSQSEPSPSPEIDVWEALRTFVPGRRRCWENIGCPPGQKEPPYLTEAGREAFDQLYRLWEGEMRNILSTQTPSPLLPLPLDCQSQLVKDVLNVLIGVSSVTFPLNEASVQFDVRPDICVSGTSPESVSRLLGELALYGTHYLRLSRFSLSSTSQKGLVFQAFTGGLRRYLHYYRACVLSTPASLSLLTIACHFRKLGRQLRYLSELCCVDGIGGVGRATFPVGVKLLSCLYNEAQSNCSNENHPVLLSLLKSSCEPYTRFVSDWVYSGIFRDVYKEFMIEVNEDYLTYRDKNFWTQGYTLISCDAEDCVPVFLKHIANDVYVCGKTINLLKICCPQHYIFWSDVPVPRIAVTFSLQEVEEIERDCAVYRGRMETIARHSAISREEQAMRTEQARQELINQVRVSAAKTLEKIRGHQVSQRLAEEAQKRERFEEMKQQLELDQEWRSAVRLKEQEDDFGYARELRDREQRLQALEEQLERRARMDLITQYSQLSEAAARRELRAMWKVQRMKLDERRVNFLQQEQQNVQALLEKFPLGQEGPPPEISQMLQPAQLHAELSEQQNPREQQTANPPLTESFAPPCSPAIGETQALKSEEIDIADFLPKPPYVPDSGAVTQALHNNGSDLLQSPQKPLPQHPHPSTSHICVGENVSEFLESVPVPNINGQASKSSFLLGQFTSEVPAGQPKASVHGHPSQSSVQLGGSTASGRNKGPIRSKSNTPAQTTQERTCEAESDSQCTEKQPTGDETGTQPLAASTGSEPKQAAQEPTEEAKSCESVSQPSHCSQPEQEQSVSLLRGFHESESDSDTRNNSHASDAHISIGEHVSKVTTPIPTPNIHGHASDAHIRIGEHVSEVTTPLPTPNIHDHTSDAHIRVGEHVSEVTSPLPTPNINGHASDENIMVGDRVSKVITPLPTPNIQGHSSDAHIRVGEHISKVITPLPTPNIQGHSSDAHIRVGEHISKVITPLPTPNIQGHSSDAHIRVGEHISKVITPLPTPNIQGHSSDAHIRVGEHISKVITPLPTPNIQGHSSDAHIRVGEHISKVITPLPTPNIQGHASDAHIRVGEHVSEVTTLIPMPNIHGHASDSHIRFGEHVSEVTTPLPMPNIHGHASDAHIRVGEHVSEVTNPLPTPNIHGHASDAHIRVGEHVSEVNNPLPTPNIHGHASDAHIRVGEHVSEVTNPVHTANIHGHASDAHIKVGEFVSDVASSLPRWSKYGHSSDSTLKVGCVMPDAAPSPTPLPGSSFGHTSDSTLTVGCVVSGVDPQPSPLPGSAYGHSSQSTLGIGCVVRRTETTRPSSLYSGAHGHSSDSALGMGCMVGGVVPGSLYGDRPPSKSDRTSEDAENPANPDIQAPPSELFSLDEGLSAWALGLGLSPKESPEDRYLLSLALQYQVEQYQDSYGLMTAAPDSELLLQVTWGPNGLPVDPSLHRATDVTAVQLNEMMPLPVLMKHSVTTPLITHVSMVNKAVVDYFFVELGVEKHFETLRHFLLMEDGEFALSLSDQLFEKLGSGQTPGELLTPLVLNSILNKALQYSVHGDSELAAHFTFALRYLPEIFHPHAPDSLNCLELRYKVDWPVNIVITDSCLNKYNRLFSFLLQLKHMVWSLRDVWFHLKRTGEISAPLSFLPLVAHPCQYFLSTVTGHSWILQVSWSEFTHKLSSANDLDAIHRTHAEYLNRAIFRGLLTEKAAPVMNIIHSIFSLILKFRGQLIAQPWELQQGEPVHPSFIAMQQSYNTFKYYSRFLFKVVTKLVDKGYQPHLEDFLLRINLNNYYKDS
ncbi:gamma-tubulin complex component 6 [Sinocyclocheilus grahami]|uniref:gamma-tubulin complex component 6 n=1 Tax=Sinocyclocheilus grahami TaxID=75366 RepID=UPI0007ACB8ED|nr:PREDICTED: gamma-tubulin complex component 6 [Sinocyclocheilus grahami]